MRRLCNITPVILAGGFGERLWPLSRKNFPKQFHNLSEENTMIQKTLLRLKGMETKNPLIFGNEEHRFIIKNQMSEIDVKCKIFLEPISKNTAPSITLGCLSLNQDDIVLVLSSDHLIKDEKTFQKQVRDACKYAEDNKIVVFGVRPSGPNINYGYINVKDTNGFGFGVKSFKEKPNKALAKKYYKDPKYFWNSGMFLFKVSTFLEELALFCPDILDICKKIHKTSKKDFEFYEFDKKVFSECPENSIDYAVMEYTGKAVMIPLKTSWSDIGSWNSLMDVSERDIDGNVVFGNVMNINSKNSMFYNLEDKLIVTNGIKDLIVVETKDALLVSNLKDNSNLKPLVKKVKEYNENLVNQSYREIRPWGSFESIRKELGYQVKKICVLPGAKLSLQKHKFRSEHWVVISGLAEVTKGNKTFTLEINESVYIPNKCVHSLKNIGIDNLIIIEVQTGTYLGEDDIERIEDVYGRK